MSKRLKFRYWKGPLHYAKVNKKREMTYGDHPETEMIFICNRKNKVMELRNEGNLLSLNALTALYCNKDHIDMIVRSLGEDGTIYSPIIGYILQRLKTKEISRDEARVLAKKWLLLNTNPYVQKQIEESLKSYGLLISAPTSFSMENPSMARQIAMLPEDEQKKILQIHAMSKGARASTKQDAT